MCVCMCVFSQAAKLKYEWITFVDAWAKTKQEKKKNQQKIDWQTEKNAYITFKRKAKSQFSGTNWEQEKLELVQRFTMNIYYLIFCHLFSFCFFFFLLLTIRLVLFKSKQSINKVINALREKRRWNKRYNQW